MSEDNKEPATGLDLTGESIHWDPDMSYAEFLNLDQILSAAQMRTGEHDEMLFLIIHQVMELWIKLALYEISAAMTLIDKDDIAPSLKMFSRVAHIHKQMMGAWDVLTTLTPVDYLKFRDKLGRSSGFQSYQFRVLEFTVGNKNAVLLKVHEGRKDAHDMVAAALNAPSMYDSVLALLARRGFDIPDYCLERDWSGPYEPSKKVEAAWLKIYRNEKEYWDLYNLGEKLTDFQHNFQLWRYHHYKTVERIIGGKRGTGGSSGLPYLAKGLEVKIFPELMDARTDL
jgi:tryptophan 2,3-dioxygenase